MPLAIIVGWNCYIHGTCEQRRGERTFKGATEWPNVTG